MRSLSPCSPLFPYTTLFRSLKASFERFVEGGGGLVVIHGADNAFPHWPAFNEMIGVGGWGGRTEKSGPLWYVKDGKDRKSTRLNSSHLVISYAVFCLKKKKK